MLDLVCSRKLTKPNKFNSNATFVEGGTNAPLETSFTESETSELPEVRSHPKLSNSRKYQKLQTKAGNFNQRPLDMSRM